MKRWLEQLFTTHPEPPLEGIRLVVGLGNPGPEYERTRHNIGFELLDHLAKQREIRWEKEHKFRSKVTIDEKGIVFAKPLTFMNLSGNAVARLIRHYQLNFDSILIVYDDTSLPVGSLRFRAKGSSGGHNGIKSIIASLGTEEFPRLRIGIDKPPTDLSLVDYVLGQFLPEEWIQMEKVLEIAQEGVNYALSDGLEATMNRFN